MLTPISSAMNFVEISVLEMLSLMIFSILSMNSLSSWWSILPSESSKALIDDL